MIALDSSVMISFLNGDGGPEVERLAGLLAEDLIVLPPSTVTELLSDPRGGAQTHAAISGLDVVPLTDGYWERAGWLRAAVRRTGAKAALGDALIAQSCLDAGLALLTRDKNFEAF